MVLCGCVGRWVDVHGVHSVTPLSLSSLYLPRSQSKPVQLGLLVSEANSGVGVSVRIKLHLGWPADGWDRPAGHLLAHARVFMCV